MPLLMAFWAGSNAAWPFAARGRELDLPADAEVAGPLHEAETVPAASRGVGGVRPLNCLGTQGMRSHEGVRFPAGPLRGPG